MARNKKEDTKQFTRANNAVYDIYRELYAMEPNNVYGQWNARTLYYRRRILRRLLPVIDFKTDLAGWDMEWLKLTLFTMGYVCVAYTSEFGIIPMRASFSGVNVYNRPTTMIVSNHLLPGSRTYTIGVDCVLMKLQYDYSGILDMVDIYAQKLANIDASIDVNLLNSRAAWIFDCDGKAQEDTAKAMYDSITKGRPAVFKRSTDNPLNSNGEIKITQLNVKNTYVTDLLQDEKRAVWYEFLTELGINNSNIDKKERVNTLEVSANSDELRNSVDDWKYNLELACKEIATVLNGRVSVEFPYYVTKNEELEKERKAMTSESNSKPI